MTTTIPVTAVSIVVAIRIAIVSMTMAITAHPGRGWGQKTP
jgi:hypothetical protein